jgi:hypothetical protein
MLDYRHPAVVIEKPLDYLGYRIDVDAASRIAQKRWV